MNHHPLHPQFAVFAWIILIAALPSCKRDVASSAAPGRLSPSNLVQSGTTMIRPGFGLSSCYLGMSVRDLEGSWIAASQIQPQFATATPTGNLGNASAGLEVAVEDHRVVSIFVYFKGSEYSPFGGTVQGGINAQSSVEDVILKLGQPTTITVTTESEYSTVPFVSLNYLQSGIDFDFLNGKLAKVGVFTPITRRKLSEFPPGFHRDIGDTRAYRAIVPDPETK